LFLLHVPAQDSILGCYAEAFLLCTFIALEDRIHKVPHLVIMALYV
jgi:hypothetical protein